MKALKSVAVALAVVLAVAMAIMIGSRWTPETVDVLAVLVGVICGVASGIPTSILLLAVMQRRDVNQAKTRLSTWPTYQHTDNGPRALPAPNHYPSYVISGRDLREQRKED